MNTHQNQTDHEDPVHRLLDQATPEAPSTVEWAGRAARRATTRRAGWVTAAVVAALAIPGYLFTTQDRPLTASPPPAASSTAPTTANPSTTGELTAVVNFYRANPYVATVICTNSSNSYPPACDGPQLVGNFSWDQVPYEEVDGSRWSTLTYRVIGYLEPDWGPGRFTLSRPFSNTYVPESPAPDNDFTAVCTNPTDGADSTKLTAAAVAARDQLLTNLPVVYSWGSNDEVNSFNVLVNGDATAARAAIRAVWSGPLCVAHSDAPTRQQQEAAFHRVAKAVPSLPEIGTTGRAGGIQVTLLMPDPAVEATIKQAAGPAIPLVISYYYEPYTG